MAFRQRLQRRHYGRTKVGLPKSKFDEATLRSEPGLIFFANNGAKGPFNDHLQSSAPLGAKAGKTRWPVCSVIDGVGMGGMRGPVGQLCLVLYFLAAIFF